VIEGPTKVSRASVISANKYGKEVIKKTSYGLEHAAHNYKPIDDSREYNKDLKEIAQSEDYKALMDKNEAYFTKK
jgi:NADH-quinone oxidoreductase subunit G